MQVIKIWFLHQVNNASNASNVSNASNISNVSNNPIQTIVSIGFR